MARKASGNLFDCHDPASSMLMNDAFSLCKRYSGELHGKG
jgi:hypothetical protein